MFEAVELGQVLRHAKYEAALPRLRSSLLQAHLDLRGQKFQVIVIVSGADGAGKGELVHRLNEWLDPRGVETHAFWEASDEELERPMHWRFWRAMPGRGRVGIFFGSWYTEPVVGRVFGRLSRGQLDAALQRIVELEQMLTADGTLLVKLWLHLPKKEQKKRLKKLERAGRLAPDDWKHFKCYDKFAKVSQRALRHTGTAAVPWRLIEATDRRYREFTAGTLLRDAIRQHLVEAAAEKAPPSPAANRRRSRRISLLDRIDEGGRLEASAYARRLKALQTRLSRLTWEARERRVSTVMVFEGWDAAGKGSGIRRVTQAMDPRLYRVVGIAAPTDEERAQHYLWRFWRHLPRSGRLAIFDRSWYGRVLVERVEGFAPPADWGRAYQEINAFEEQLVEHGIVVIKFWLNVSAREQLRRFRERQEVVYKRYKITEEDWRNRSKRGAYQVAVEEMIERCSTEVAPWTLVAGDDKKSARVSILQTAVERLETAL